MDRKGIMVFAQQNDGEIHKVTYELINKAKELGNSQEMPIYAALFGMVQTPIEELFYRGVDKVFLIEDSMMDQPDEMLYTENFYNVIKIANPEIVLIGATAFGRSIAPRLAARLETGLTADCTDLKIDGDGKLIQIRPAFSDNILAHIKTDTLPQMATIRYKEFEEATRDESKTGEIIHITAQALNVSFVEIIKKISSKEIDISEAEIIVSGGRGLKKAEDFKMLEKLANLIGGVVGASRAVVDDGYISKDHQVGYSGNRVKPKIYIACGISGAAQHIAGMRESDTIIAINNDPSAQIFNYADIGIVADMYEIVPQMISYLNNKRRV
ncbi:MAG: electron transfer flavoprotein subunit alpha/FixB family protein [Clostridiales bacterium]|nr:electron transfer flavoprotein subunit alpha/FixB family protein [Clostridiales bacterium]